MSKSVRTAGAAWAWVLGVITPFAVFTMAIAVKGGVERVRGEAQSASRIDTVPAAAVASPYRYTFDHDGVLEEASAPDETRSPYWWVNSGGRLVVKRGVGSTLVGEVSPADPWRAKYAAANPLDTSDGKYPQDIFRLFTRSAWGDVRETVYARVTAIHASASPNRNLSNGILLISRYQDGDDLYYAGVRVDGTAVVKKKIGGTYYTLGETPVFPGTYDAATNPNLIPENVWIGIRSETRTFRDGTVRIRLLLDIGRTGNWQLILDTADVGGERPPILKSGWAGIRTDFMDAEFDDYELVTL